MENNFDCFRLQNGLEIPCLAYGTYQAAETQDCQTLRLAIEAGYRYFDTASFYHTETFVAQAIRDSGLPREEFFLTSKAWKTEMGYHAVKAAFQRSLENLNTEYLDLYLIHWPLPSPDYKDWKALDVETWQALEELYREKKVRAIGLSNFLPHHIENILQHCAIAPMVDQIEFHPGYTQEATVQYCKMHQILVQAWSPIGRGVILQDPLLIELSEKYGVSPAQICLRFALDRQIIPLPKASSLKRMQENRDLFRFKISQEDQYRLETMPQIGWSGNHPDRPKVDIS